MSTNIVSTSWPIIGSKAITRNGISIGINNSLPSRATFYNCVSPFAGTLSNKYYTIYVKNIKQEPVVYPYLFGNSLIAFAQSLGCPFNTVDTCLFWLNGGNYGSVDNFSVDSVIAVDRNYWPVVTDGMVLFMDAKYALSGTSVYPSTYSEYLLDVSGSGGIAINQYNGIGYNGAAIVGNYCNSMFFDGVDDYLQISHNTSLNISGSITVEAWFYFGATIFGLTDPCIVSKYSNAGGGTNQAWILFIATADYRAYGPGNTGPNVGEIGWIATSSGNINGALIGTGEQYPLYKWAHVVGVFDSSNNTMQLYINGVLKRSVTRTGQTSGVLATNTRPVQVAATTFDNSRWYNGFLSALRIYKKALTDAQVKQNYYQGAVPTDQLVLFLDSSNFASISNSNIVNWYDLSPSTGVTNTGTNYNFNYAISASGCLRLGGINSYSLVASNSCTNLTSNYTISVWFKANAYSGPTQSIISKRDISPGSNGGYDLQLIYSGGINYVVWTVGLSSGTSSITANINSQITSGQWIHVCITGNNTTSYMYVNGVLSVSGSVPSPVSNTKQLNIGRFGSYGGSSDAGYYLSGLIGSIMIYQKGLTDSEIGSIHDIQRCNYPIFGY